MIFIGYGSELVLVVLEVHFQLCQNSLGQLGMEIVGARDSKNLLFLILILSSYPSSFQEVVLDCNVKLEDDDILTRHFKVIEIIKRYQTMKYNPSLILQIGVKSSVAVQRKQASSSSS